MKEIEGVEEFIDETIEELKGETGDGVLDEDALREPVSTLEPRKPVVVGPQTPALEAVAVMRAQGMGCVLVVRSNRLKGIFTERDVLNHLVGLGPEVAKTPVRKLMTSNPETLRPSDSIAYALNKMSLGGYRHIPLVDNSDAPVGVISVKDIVNYLVKLFPKSVMNLPTLPRGNYAREREGA
ncbi:MAG: CBS domain-containing protein [Deltaproteobacteria bacterium]|jgi:CBS domain-containing protein|nr:CBS domain-containing protein [Deltaproteobacteria bacterium]